MFKRASLVLGLVALAGCNDNLPDDAVTLDWNAGETFYVGAAYRLGKISTEENAVDLEGNAQPDFDEAWTDEVFWTYQVVESGLVPAEGDELFPYAQHFNGTASLTVIRAFIDPTLNFDEELIEADPVVYLVFREDRDRLAAIISFTNVDGERVEQAWSSKQLGKSWSALSQSMLTAAPTYLAPFTARYADEEKVLENGSLLETVAIDDGVVDTYYDDEIGGGLVMSRYESGQPWPTYTLGDNVETRLLTASDVDARRGDLPPFLPEDAEDFDYKAALYASIDIDAALILDDETMSGGYEAEVVRHYQPWAGSWWPQSKGELVFGWRGYSATTKDTISDEFYSTLEPMKAELDLLSEEIRTMSDGADKDAKREEYKTKQEAFVDKLVESYNGVLQGLVGGQIVVADGKVTHTVDGWSYDIETLSPMDKYALHLYLEGQTSPNPFFGPAWELLNHWSPEGGSWWGHCNGWSAAAILENEPRETVTTNVAGHGFSYTTADQKGLTTELHYSTYSRFYGSRYYKEGDDISDLSPKAFHQLVTFYFREQGVPLVFDTSADEQVWNYPAYGVDMDVVETTEGGNLTNINTAGIPVLMELPGIGDALAARIVEYREMNGPFQTKDEVMEVRGIGTGTFEGIRDLITVNARQREFSVTAYVVFTTDGVDEEWLDNPDGAPKGFTKTYKYTLKTDEKGRVVEGTWDNEREHPDFAWIPYSNPTGYSNGGSENPYITYGGYLSKVVDNRR